MLGICLRYSKDIEEAKDIMHDGYIKIFLNINEFKGESSLSTWMTRIMINTAINQIRKRKKLNQNYDFDTLGLEINDQSNDLGEEDIKDNTIEEVLKWVHQLPEKYRVIINMYAIDGMSHRDIANELGISEGTSRSQLSRARSLISKYIKERNRIKNAI